MADIVCPVCGTHNPPTRTFCLKCAADLHAPVPDATTVMPTPRTEVPLRPVLIGGGIALAAIAVIAILVVVAGSLGASPAPSSGPSAGPTGPAGPGSTETVTPAESVAATPAESAAPTATPTTAPTAGPPATPVVTPIPPPVILEFTGPKTVDCTDPQFSGFIHLSWLIDNADSTELSIDGPGLYQAYPGALGQDDVPFGCGAGQHTYTLTTVGGNGAPATRTLTVKEG